MTAIKKNIIEEKLKFFCKDNNISNLNDGFMYYIYSLYEDIEYNDIDENDIVDGSEDKQIDMIKVEEINETLIINIYQVKKESGFSSNTVIHMKNGLDWIFEIESDKIEDNKNKKLISKIKEIRSKFKDYGMSDMVVRLNYVSMGNKKDICENDEFDQEYKNLISKYSAKGFKSFEFNIIGVEEISQYLDLVSYKNKKIDIDIPIIVNANIPSLIEMHDKDINSIICTARAEDIAKIVLQDKGDILFDKNIRKYLDLRGKVNKEIYRTCTDKDDSNLFWYLNNGITIICDKLDKSFIGDDYTIKLKNAQIINGCQTSTTLYEAFKKDKLDKNTKLILRVYQTLDAELTKKITIATNNQNAINIKDLRSNDEIQKKIQEYIYITYGYNVEIKRNEFKNNNKIEKEKVVTNEKLGQAFLAVMLDKPYTALSSKATIFNSNYERIFNDKSYEGLMFSYLILKYVNSKKKENLEKYEQLKVDIIMYGHFHISYILGKLILHKDNANMKSLEKIKQLNIKLINNEIELDDIYDSIIEKIYEKLKGNEEISKNVMSVLRKSESLRDIDHILNELK